MNRCVFCDEELTNGQQTSLLGQRGVDGINKVGDENIHVEVGQIVHTLCRRNLSQTRPIIISTKSTRKLKHKCYIKSTFHRTSICFQGALFFCVGIQPSMMAEKKRV